MLELVALVLEHVESLILHLPASSPGVRHFPDRLGRQFVAGDPCIVVDLLTGILPHSDDFTPVDSNGRWFCRLWRRSSPVHRRQDVG
jgi:hypothetical protein